MKILSGCETRGVPRQTHPSPFGVTAVTDRETGRQENRQIDRNRDRQTGDRQSGI
jgi:hypothetical protein